MSAPDIITRLQQTRANMLGTDDEQHFFDCHDAAAEIKKLRDDNTAAYAFIADIRAALGDADGKFMQADFLAYCQALRAAAASVPESAAEPVAWAFYNLDGSMRFIIDSEERMRAWSTAHSGAIVPLYAHPPAVTKNA